MDIAGVNDIGRACNADMENVFLAIYLCKQKVGGIVYGV